MTLRARFAVLLPLLGLLIPGSLPAHSEPVGATPASPSLKMAQKVDDDDAAKQQQKKKKKGDNAGDRPKGDGKKGDGKKQGQQKKDAGQSKKAGGPQADEAKNKALKQKQNADQARKDAAKKKQNADEAAKQKALKQKQNADQARKDAAKKKQNADEAAKQKALKQKQNADQARKDAAKKNQDAAEAAKQKALKQKQNADQARKDAAKKKQDADEAAKQKALNQKQNADQARKDAAKKNQDAADEAKQKAARQKALKQKQDAAAAGKKKSGPPPKFDKGQVDREFEKAREQARQKSAPTAGARPSNNEKWRDGSDKKFEAMRKERKERVDATGSRRIIVEPDKRVIVRHNDRAFIRHDESRRLQRTGRELRRERRKDGTLMIVTMGLAGALIYSLQDDNGHLLRRTRRGKDGREAVLIDNRRFYRDRPRPRFGGMGYTEAYISLPPPVVRIPREQYIVEYDQASPDDIYDALMAPPVEDLERGYSLDEVRQSYGVLERMRRVDLNAITFEFGSWDVGEDQAPRLENIATAMHRILQESPEEMFLIEGHTDAVGADIDNLSLSDRRAESVAVILTEEFEIPPENLMTQGYGEEQLKELTDGPSRINRRVSVRRITPLLTREGWDDTEG